MVAYPQFLVRPVDRTVGGGDRNGVRVAVNDRAEEQFLVARIVKASGEDPNYNDRSQGDRAKESFLHPSCLHIPSNAYTKFRDI